MALNSPRTIDLLGTGLRKEATVASGATIKPGYLVRLTSTGLNTHNVAAGNHGRIFAVENDIAGKDIGDTYTVGEKCQYAAFPPGSEVLCRLAAAATAIAVGDYVESNGTGTVRKASTNAATSEAQRAGIIGYALEAVDNSGGGSEVTIRIATV